MGAKTFTAKDDLYAEFKSLCAKEGCGVGDKLNEFMAKFIQEHGDGNPTFTMDQFINAPDFLATPALFRTPEDIAKYISKIKGTKQYEKVGAKLNVWAKIYNMEQENES